MKEFHAGSSDAWEAICVEQFQLCRIDWAASSFGAGLRATTTIPNFSLQLLTSGAFGVSRTPLHARRHESDDLMVVLQHGGDAGLVEHKGVRTELGAGEGILIDTRFPYVFDFRSPVRQTVLKLPRNAAGRLEKAAGRIIPLADGPSARVFNTIISELVRMDDHGSVDGDQAGQKAGRLRPETSTPGAEANVIATAAIDILAAMYAADQGASSGSPGHEALLRSAQDFIRSRFWDVEMTPALVAGHLGISPRFLSQIFERSGHSPAAYIRQVRLEQAERLLRHPSQRDAAIFDVGLRVGFPDATTFTRAFRRAYGVVPSEYRAVAFHP
ncbi:AraC family transcriptional regulator [Arthrobacter ginkgonis]|uniref:AraC family transcriptional regulator n=1 Tax=Arthrobacter ginkgonis TaxID=1630594 RepID=A0ABP7DEZ0_9MICC